MGFEQGQRTRHRFAGRAQQLRQRNLRRQWHGRTVVNLRQQEQAMGDPSCYLGTAGGLRPSGDRSKSNAAGSADLIPDLLVTARQAGQRFR